MGDFHTRPSVLEGQQPARIYSQDEIEDFVHWATAGKYLSGGLVVISAVYIVMTLLGTL